MGYGFMVMLTLPGLPEPLPASPEDRNPRGRYFSTWWGALFSGARFTTRALLLLAAFTSGSFGCSVPVFRYALDRWAPDAFRLEAPQAAFQTEPLATEFRNLGQVSPLNLEALRIAGAPPDGAATLSFPSHDGRESAVVWTGTLNPATFKTIIESAGRKEAARRIIAGDSAVWVLVEGGKREADDAAAELLTKRLTFLESAAELPVIDPNDPTSRIGPGPVLQAKFSVLKIRRDDPAEAAFIAMLAGPEGLAALPKDGPFAALVFGRGRVLGAWPGEKLTSELIEEATLFLTGACSCEVKNLNPGWDLLTNVDWDSELEKAEEVRVAAINATAETTSAPQEKPAAPVKPETVTIGAPVPIPVALAKPDSFPRAPLYIAGAVLLLALAFFGKRRSTS